MSPPASGKFSQLLLEGLDHYRKGKMLEAVRAWEEAYLLEPTNLRAREFLRSALERIHAHMAPVAPVSPQAAPHPWLPPSRSESTTLPGRPSALFKASGGAAAVPAPSDETMLFAAPSDPDGPTTITRATSSWDDVARPPSSAWDEVARPPSTPWDDGPSIALPQAADDRAAYPGDDASGAWSIHKDPLPIEAVATDEIDVWMKGAHELVGLNDFSGALELTYKILERKPVDKEAQQVHDLCEHNLTQMFESKIGAMEARPKVAIPPDEIIWLNLDPRAGFVLAQIDGEVSFEDLYAICGLERLDTARILSQLLEEGVVAVHGEQAAVAKRALQRQR